MTARRLLLAVLLVAVGCTGDDDGGDDRAAPSPATRITDPAPDCLGIGAPPDGAVLTFVAGGRLHAAGEGDERPCLVAGPADPRAVSWGPRADRVLLAADRAVLPSGRVISPFGRDARQVAWSQPEGKSVVAVTADGRLLKHRTIEAEPTEVTFLARHDEAVYHPAGLHILSAGEADDGTYGIFLATNQGADVRPTTVAEDARRVYALAWLPGGQSFRFLADHETFWEVHQVDLDGLAFSTLLTTADELVALAVAPFDGVDATAVQVGRCDGRTRVDVDRGGGTWQPAGGEALRGRSVAPVGWVDEDTLALLARDDGCEGPGDLYVWSGGEPDLVAGDVDAAAVRVVAADPPEPPVATDDPPPA